MKWLDSIWDALGFTKDTQSAKQSQSEDFYNENTFVGAVFRNNRAKIEELCYNSKKQRYNWDRMLRHDRRGAVGECCFHICFLFPSEQNLEMAKWLLSKNTRLIDTSKYHDSVHTLKFRVEGTGRTPIIFTVYVNGQFFFVILSLDSDIFSFVLRINFTI